MSSKVKVSRIVLVINGKEISLSIEEAKELYGLLGELFEQKKETVVIKRERYPYYPHIYVKPYIAEPYITWNQTFSTTGDTAVLTLTNTACTNYS